MKSSPPIRIFRMLLAIAVSLWMAGAGCLWGCSNSTTLAAEVDVSEHAKVPTVVAGNSCHAKTHDCCAKQASNQTETTDDAEKLSNAFALLPSGMMKDCPLAVSSNALTVKSNFDSGGQDLTPIVHRPRVEVDVHRVDKHPPVEFLNRGPTYLHCCVFLI